MMDLVPTPNKVDIERVVLGAALSDEDSSAAIIEGLSDEDFYDSKHKIIYKAISEVFRKGMTTNLVTVNDNLNTNKDREISSIYLVNLIEALPVMYNIDDFIALLKQSTAERKIFELSALFKEGKVGIEEFTDKIISIPQFGKVDNETLGDLFVNTLVTASQGVAYKFGLEPLNKYLGGVDKGETITIGGHTSQGKCLKKGTKVVMYSGELKNVEDIRVGDLVMGVDSSPRTVLFLHSGVDDLYTVNQSRGASYTVNSRHILSLKKSDYAKAKGRYKKTNSDTRRNPNGMYPSYGDTVNIGIDEYLKKSKSWKKHFMGYKVGVEFPEKEVKIDPYFLGLWLGDGSSRSVLITTEDSPIQEYMGEVAREFDMKLVKRKTKKASSYAISKKKGLKYNEILEILRDYSLIRNKHIPDDYLYNTKEVRLQLLAGLIDTDGYRNQNSYQVIQKNKQLAYQIYYLANSLGFWCSIREVKKTIKDRGFSGNYYQIGICGQVNVIPVKLERKKILTKKFYRNPMLTGITVEYEGKGEYFGFVLDGDGLFFLEDFTVTHNTMFCIQLAIDFAERGYKVLYCTSEMTPIETARRILSNQTNVNIMDFRKGFLTDEEKEKIKTMGDTLAKIWNLTIKTTTTTAEIIRLSKKYDPDIIFVDHLQNLTRHGNYSDYQRVTYNMADLQNLALTNKKVCFVASQLKRKSEDRYSAPPIISDLRDSGAIEEKSNVVLFVYWKKRMLEEVKPRYGGEDPEHVDILISKNRDGVIGGIPLDFYPEYCKFTDRYVQVINVRRNYPKPKPNLFRKDID